MLELIKYLYDRASEAVKYGIPISKVKDDVLFNNVMKMKYTIPNEDLRGIGRLMKEIDDYYTELISQYKHKVSN
jgi:V/A-type H+-transporting ATPase subunit A